MGNLAGAAEDDVVVPVAGRDGDEILWIRAHEHLADLEGLSDVADDGVQLRERHGDVGEGVVQQVGVPVLDVQPGVYDERPRLVAVVVPGVGVRRNTSSVQSSASQASVAARQVALSGRPGIWGKKAPSRPVVGAGAVREHDPWGLLVAHVAARGGAPRAAGGADAGAVAGMREARDDSAQEIRREVGPRHRRSF